MEYRPFYLAREWVRLGHKVTIAAASFSHVRTNPPNINGVVTREEIEGIRYFWLKTPRYDGNGIRRGINILTFVGRLLSHQNSLLVTGKPDVVIASSTYPLDIIPGYRMAKAFGAKLIFEVHDLWPLSLIELGKMSPKHPFVMFLQWAEKFCLP